MEYKICLICGRHIHGEHATKAIMTTTGPDIIHSGRCYYIWVLMNR